MANPFAGELKITFNDYTKEVKDYKWQMKTLSLTEAKTLKIGNQ